MVKFMKPRGSLRESKELPLEGDWKKEMKSWRNLPMLTQKSMIVKSQVINRKNLQNLWDIAPSQAYEGNVSSTDGDRSAHTAVYLRDYEYTAVYWPECDYKTVFTPPT
ncbi:hypothetical protein MA16_Dca007627 [Dendrobium catenatum]|uniref:Uncharacterized protein n=1 Tax=Dendrobium catenatum TaxID=906689 RepID=A0A2I0X0T7_9ASPA|nr:hypothetical protein MA16_Dca007627 [Dendrobium catenatum]